MTARLSIVMPVLDEAAEIEAALARACAAIARAASRSSWSTAAARDDTAALARPLADRVMTAPRGRASQMNAGAAAARGDVLLFLHADTRLPDGADRLLTGGLAASGRVWGRFDLRFDSGGLLRIVAAMMNLRSRATGIATGDQAIFVTRAAFERAGGFPPTRADGRRGAVGTSQACQPSALSHRPRDHRRPALAPARRSSAPSC